MGMISSLAKVVRQGVSGKRTWTPDEVRQLIDRRALDEARRVVEQLLPALKNRDAERDCLLGEISFQERDDEKALAAFHEALKVVPGMAAAHHGLSLVLAERGEFDDALRHAQFALSSQPKEGRYLAQLGYCHLCVENYQSAENPLRRATLSMANNAYLWNNLGIVLRVKGDLPEALQCFRQAHQLDASHEGVQQHLAQTEAELQGQTREVSLSIDNSHRLRPPEASLDAAAFQRIIELETAGELQQAIDVCESLLLQDPDDDRTPVLLSRLYERVGDVASSIDTLQAHLSSRPGAGRVAGALGLMCLRAQDFQRAVPLLERALEEAPEHLDYVVGLAQALSGEWRFAEAGPLFVRATELSPDSVELVGLQASNLANRCLYDEALAIIDGLTDRGLYISCKGPVLAFLGRFEEALKALDEDLARRPNEASLRFQRAFFNLLLEKYAEGWDDYAYRSFGAASKNFRTLPFRIWRGEPLNGKRVIVLAEQGLGDQIMFASCLPDLLAMEPSRVVVEMSQRVSKTVARSFPSCAVVGTHQSADLDWVKDYPDTDCFIQLADLPAHFRRSRDDFPLHRGYLRADPERVAFWRERLRAVGPGPYIGASWRGGTELTRTAVRSLEPEQLFPLGNATPATWVCLQYGSVQAEVDRMTGTGMPLHHWPEAIADLDEFAALIEALDLVVTVCNTTVHYTGALGKPVWILAPKVPEWRYGLYCESMPWYPSSRVYRQREAGDWAELVARVEQDLSAHFAVA